MITLDQLTSAQRTSLSQTADARGESINDYLLDLSPDPFMDDAIQGILPHYCDGAELGVIADVRVDIGVYCHSR
jgi:hypothetical protein